MSLLMFGAAMFDAPWSSQRDKASSVRPSAFPKKGGCKVGVALRLGSHVRGGEHGEHVAAIC